MASRFGAMLWLCLCSASLVGAFSPLVALPSRQGRFTTSGLFSDWDDNSLDSNKWKSSAEESENPEDWQDVLGRKSDGSFWSSFDSSEDDSVLANEITDEDQGADESEAWLDALASLQAEEVEFNMKEADRADKVRQMQEWGFDPSTIESTLDVAMDTSLEVADELEGMQAFREESYIDEDDLTTLESHTKVEKDEDSGDPIRSQMVYVDEHTCIGCTNCATTAQSTFFMEPGLGRARVFSQWGDDDETVQIAIETCPVDCIHYVPYEELVRLEVERRGQNINFKARLVSQAEYGGSGQNKVGGPVGFTDAPRISGNMGSRCNNCPTRGCQTCPMYGVGKNPVFEEKERLRQEKAAKRRLQQERDRDNKSADL